MEKKLNIKRVKVSTVWIDPEKEVISTKEKTKGMKFILCPVNLKIADDDKEFAGQRIYGAVFEYKDKKDAKKNRTATSNAEYFKSQVEGKEILINVIHDEYINKDLEKKTSLKFTTLTKAEKAVAEQFIK